MTTTKHRDRRRDLGAFLRACRERLAPEEAGVPAASFRRRRTPGLRREEVAQLSGLSPTWYTWIEQGRDISMSARALARVSDTLRLTPAERRYLFELAGARDPHERADAPDDHLPPPVLAAAVHACSTPAYLLDPAWNACAWNEAAVALFGGWLGPRSSGEGPRNLLRYVFLEPEARHFICDWPERARRLVAEFRGDTSRHADDAAVAALTAELLATSGDFAERWNDLRVLEREGGARAFEHPAHGRLEFSQLTLRPASFDAWKLVMLLPRDAAEDG